jgi:hypothetical protein
MWLHKFKYLWDVLPLRIRAICCISWNIIRDIQWQRKLDAFPALIFAFQLMSLIQRHVKTAKHKQLSWLKKAKSRSQTGGWVGSTNDMWETATKTTLILRVASAKPARTTYLCNSIQHSFSQEANSYSELQNKNGPLVDLDAGYKLVFSLCWQRIFSLSGI